MMTPRRQAAVCLFAALTLGTAASAQVMPIVPPPPPPVEDVNIVTVEGRGDSQEAALRDALRQAVEKAAGQFIHSQSQTQNYQVVLDQVLSKSAGFVKRYEPNPPLYVGPDANGIVTCRITAHVSVKEVTTEWGEIQILLQQKGKPRIMVIIGERIDGQQQEDSTVASEIEKQLLSNDFPMVDKGQFNEIQRRDVRAASFEEDLARVIALGKQFGAEVIIVGSSQADSAGEEDLFGVKAHMYGTTVKVRVVRTDNAALMFSENVTTRKGSRTKTGGAHAALRDAGVQMARKVQDGIVAKWGREVAEGQSINLEVSNITFGQRSKLTEVIKKLPKVKAVQERSYAGRVAFYTVDIVGSADDLAKAMMELKDWNLEITEASATAVKCKLEGGE